MLQPPLSHNEPTLCNPPQSPAPSAARLDGSSVPRRQDVSRRAEAAATALATHVSKGLEQRAIEGKHTGGIPFGYQSCWTDGEKDVNKATKVMQWE
jgi:hypothetical protein